MFHTSTFLASMFASKESKKVHIYERFPYWSKEEIAQMRIAEMKNYFKTHSKPKTDEEV